MEKETAAASPGPRARWRSWRTRASRRGWRKSVGFGGRARRAGAGHLGTPTETEGRRRPRRTATRGAPEGDAAGPSPSDGHERQASNGCRTVAEVPGARGRGLAPARGGADHRGPGAGEQQEGDRAGHRRWSPGRTWSRVDGKLVDAAGEHVVPTALQAGRRGDDAGGSAGPAHGGHYLDDDRQRRVPGGPAGLRRRGRAAAHRRRGAGPQADAPELPGAAHVPGEGEGRAGPGHAGQAARRGAAGGRMATPGRWTSSSRPSATPG